MLAGGPRRFILVLCHQFSRRQTTGSFFGGTVQWVGHGDSAAAGRWRGPIHHLVVGFVDAGWFPLVDVGRSFTTVSFVLLSCFILSDS